MDQIVLIGGGGHCLACIDVIELEKKYRIVGILDLPEKVGHKILGIEVIGTDKDIPELVRKYKNFLITIGQIKSSFRRVEAYNLIKQNAGSLPVIISPKAYVSKSSLIGEGSIVMHNALINSKAVVGKNCIINTGALIEHEALIGDFCHISTQATINGQVIVGQNSFIGSNSVIANNVSLPDNIVVAAGACILKTPDKSGTFIGNPARNSMK